MKSSSTARRSLRFGAFEVDLQAGLVRKHGIRVRIQHQPLKVLAALLDRPGEVVTREELRHMLWPADTYVDFEQGLNAAVTRLRQALSDSADTPRFIETHARTGYRFIAPVEVVSDANQSPPHANIAIVGRAVSFSRDRLPWLAVGLFSTLLLVSSVIWLALRHTAKPEIPLKPIPLTSYSGVESMPSFSPDGNQVAFQWAQGNGEPHIYIKLIGSGDPLRLTSGAGGEYGPAWSRDGRQIAFIRGLGQPRISVFVVPSLGGIERKAGEFSCSSRPPDFLKALTPSRWIDWLPDGKHLVVSADDPDFGHGLFLLSLDTGDRRSITNLSADGKINARNPSVSPDGRNIAFCRMSAPLMGELYTVPLSADLQAGEPRRLTSIVGHCAMPTWTPNGREIVFQSTKDGDTALWRIALDGGSTPRRLAAPGTEVVHPAVSQRGTLAYARAFVDDNIWRQQLLSRPGTVQEPVSLIASTAKDASPHYSPADGRIAFMSTRSGNWEIWVCGNDGRHCVQLTAMNGPETGSPQWSPDGKRIAFNSAADGNFNIYVIDADGGPARRLTDNPAGDNLPSWSADGKWIYFRSTRTGKSEIWKAPADGGAAVQVTRTGGDTAFEAPNHRVLYYTKENFKDKLWRSAVDGSAESEVLDAVIAGGFVVQNDRLYYLHPEPDGTTALRCLLPDIGKDFLISLITKPVSLGLSVSPDGKQILFSQIDQRGSDLMLLNGFK